MKFVLIALTSLLSTVAFAAGSSLNGVVIKVEPPEVTRRTFDPANPPKEMPKLTPPEVGTCVYSFGCSTEVVMRGARGRTARVTGVQVTTRLAITLWTPHQGPAKILEHEEGHRQIAEMYYQLAEPVARQLAERTLGAPVRASNRDQGAAEVELMKLQNAIIADYLRDTARRCDMAQARFDAITQHSMNSIPEAEAIARAITEEEAESARMQSLVDRTMAMDSPQAPIRRRPTRPRSSTGFP